MRSGHEHSSPGPGSRRTGRDAGRGATGHSSASTPAARRSSASASAGASACVNVARDGLGRALEQAVGDLDARRAVLQRRERVHHALRRVLALDQRRRASRPPPSRSALVVDDERRAVGLAGEHVDEAGHQRAAAVRLEREREAGLAADAATRRPAARRAATRRRPRPAPARPRRRPGRAAAPPLRRRPRPLRPPGGSGRAKSSSSSRAWMSEPRSASSPSQGLRRRGAGRVEARGRATGGVAAAATGPGGRVGVGRRLHARHPSSRWR